MTFTFNNFGAEMLRFVTAQAGQILPRPIINTNRAHSFLSVDAREPASDAPSPPPAGGRLFEEQA